jgi:MerR family transcriptional regulator, light-induced transcriptional regulator
VSATPSLRPLAHSPPYVGEVPSGLVFQTLFIVRLARELAPIGARAHDGAVTAHPALAPGLTVAAAARRIGVAPGTLRTWDRRYGIGPGDHAPGRHRRYSPSDLARLELMQRALVRGASPADAARYALATPLPQHGADPDPVVRPVRSAPAAPGPTDPAARSRFGGRVLRLPGAGPKARGLGRAALALDAVAVADLLTESVRGDGVATTWDDVVRPVLRALGDRWSGSDTGVEVEHLVSACVSAVFGAVLGGSSPAGPVPDARPVLLAAMPGEQHALPILALAAELHGCPVAHRYLGADLPATALTAAVRRTAPVAVVLWAQVPATADVGVLHALPGTRPRYRVFAAGPGWDGAVLPARTARLTSLREAVTTISGTVRV